MESIEVTDAGLAHLVELPLLRELYFWFPHFTDEGMKHLAQNTDLYELSIMDNSELTDAGLEHLQELPNLQHLVLATSPKDYEKLSGNKVASYLAKLKNLKTLTLRLRDFTDTGMKQLTELTLLEELTLNSQITDVGLQYLKQLPHLRKLHIASHNLSDRISYAGFDNLTNLQSLKITGRITEINDTGLACLGELVNLRELILSTNYRKHKVTDAGLKQFENLTRLEKLSLYILLDLEDLSKYFNSSPHLKTLELPDRHLTDNTLQQITHWKELRELDLSRNAITNAGLKHLSNLADLRKLSLAFNDISNLSHLQELTNLKELNLQSTKITNADLIHLKQMKNLEKLNLNNTKVTAEGFVHLEGLKKLRDLELTDRFSATDEQLDQLKAALPHCRPVSGYDDL